MTTALPLWMRSAARCAALVAVLAGCAATVHAQTPSVRAYVRADSVLVGQRVELVVVTESRADAVPVFPPTEAFAVLGDFEIVGGPIVSAPEQQGSLRRDSAVYAATTFALDTALVAPLDVAFVVDEDTVRVQTLARGVRVASVLPDSGATLLGLGDVAEFPRPWWFWGLWLLALAVILGGLYMWWRARQRGEGSRSAKEAPRASPYDEARQRLAALRADGPDPAAPKPYFVELSDALRTYLERRTGVPALEMTSAELVRRLRERPPRGITAAEADAAARSLSVADFAKFADGRPSDEDSRTALAAAARVVDTVEAAHMRDEVPEASASDAPVEPAA